MSKLNKYLKLTLKERERSKFSFEDKNDDIIQLLDKANHELEQYYTGKMCFDICEDEKEHNPPDKLKKITPKKKRKIKEIWLQFDSHLSEIQRKYEKYLQESLEKEK